MIYFSSQAVKPLRKIANYFAGEGDNLVVGKMLSADALGNYSQAYKLMVAPVRLIGQSLNIIFISSFSLCSKRQNSSKKSLLQVYSICSLYFFDYFSCFIC